MSVETTSIAVENLIADHVATSFPLEGASSGTADTAAQIRRRITDRFQAPHLSAEQDNSPPAIQALYNRLFSAFSIAQPAAGTVHDRLLQLNLLQKSLEALCHGTRAAPRKGTNSANVDLLLERQQLALKNEYTMGFGRIEMWLVSIAAFILVLLNAIDILWSIPVLGLSIGRSWHLDRQCKKRCARIAEIDAIVGPTGQRFQS